MTKNYIGIVRDHSGSMQSHVRLAAADYNLIIEGIKSSSDEIDSIVSVVKCGVGYQARVERETVLSSVNALKPITSYVADGSGTPLWDSVGELINIFEGVPDFGDKDVSFLLMIITDGQENRSQFWTSHALRVKIQELQATDHWTFTFRVPHGYSLALQRMLGVAPGNILEWEQTEAGFRAATQSTISALRSYGTTLRSGGRSTNRFYADLSQVSPAEIKRELTDISRRVKIWSVNGSSSIVIKDFCELKGKEPYVKGRAYYELAKTETVQDYKEIAIRDRATSKIYSGHAARELLGLPVFGQIRLSPGDHGGYDIFIQSTSVNRVLHPGTKLLYVVKP